MFSIDWKGLKAQLEKDLAAIDNEEKMFDFLQSIFVCYSLSQALGSEKVDEFIKKIKSKTKKRKS